MYALILNWDLSEKPRKYFRNYENTLLMSHGKDMRTKKSLFKRYGTQILKQDNSEAFIFGKRKKQWKKKYEQCTE